MRKQIVENAAFEVATQVRAVEDCIESALIEIAELQARMVRARTSMGVGFATGHAAFEQLSGALSALIAARGGMVHCHAALVEAKQGVPGLRTTSFGDDDCPPPAALSPLRIVA